MEIILISCFLLGAFLAVVFPKDKEEQFLQPAADLIFGKDDPIEEIEIYDDTPQEIGTKDDWNRICHAAIKKAKSGDSSARTWVTKHVYNKHKVPKPPKVGKPPRETRKETPQLTSTKLIEEAVMFLCCLGEKKRKVDSIVKDLGTKKKYEKVEDLVKDFYKRS